MTRINARADALAPWRAPAAFGPEWADWLSCAWHFMGSHLQIGDIVKICPETQARLYGGPVPAPVYRKGTRPVLENLLYELLDHPAPRKLAPPGKALLLAEWTYWEVFRRGEALRRGRWSQQLVEGGEEEEVAALDGRTGSFECSRLLCVLLQMEAIPARLAFVFGAPFDGRVGVEAHIDGRWRYFDLAKNRQYGHRCGGLTDLVKAVRELRAAPKGSQLGLADYPVKEHSAWTPGRYARRNG